LYNNPDFSQLSVKKLEQVEIGVTKYFVGHRLKIQGNLIHANRTNLLDDTYDGGFWSAIFQVEIGI
jgi:phosphate-selective porin OprO and OprP